MTSIKHQLFIHVDYSPDGLEIRYGYPYSHPHELKEQLIRMPRNKIPPKVRSELESIVRALACRIPKPAMVRLPHAQIAPTVRHGIATIVVQDQQPGRTPLARLYYYEEVKDIGSMIEKEVRIEPGSWSAAERGSWDRLRSAIKAMAWKDYERLAGAHLFP